LGFEDLFEDLLDDFDVNEDAIWQDLFLEFSADY
jgi:hypothetical protein